MRHDWIFELLSDLHAYACRNDLPGVARKVEETILEMQREAGVDPALGGPPVARRSRAH